MYHTIVWSVQLKDSVSTGEGSRPVIWALRRCSRTGRVDGVGREARRAEIAGSSWLMTCIIDINGRYGSHVATYD